MSRSDRGMGWGFAGWNGKVAKTLSLEPCDNILELCSKNQDSPEEVICVTPCINLFGANVADILLQIVIDRLRTKSPHCAEAHLCASAQPRAMRSAALRAAFCISIGGHRSKTDRGSQKEKVGQSTYLLSLSSPNNFEPLILRFLHMLYS